MAGNRILILALLAVILATTFLTGCGRAAIAGKDGEMMRYELSEIDNDGFYVHNLDDDTFTPVMNGASGYEDAELDDEVSVIWMASSDYDLIELTPAVLKGKSELVAVYGSENTIPQSLLVEGFENLGYTIGAKFSLSENGREMFINTQDICESSECVKKLEEYSDGLLPVEGIMISDGKIVLPAENVDSRAELLLGLEKDRYYGVCFYDGTRYCEEDLKADTLALLKISEVSLARPYSETKDGYFIVELPDNIEDGYYYINGEGVFEYSEKENNEKKD